MLQLSLTVAVYEMKINIGTIIPIIIDIIGIRPGGVGG